MPYTKAHKAQTRARIVAAAARAFRAGGIGKVAIPALMRDAGLTHGGFYAHFASKDELVAEACARGLSESSQAILAQAESQPPDEALRLIIRAYLSRGHRDYPETGCVIAALGTELAREPVEVRAAFDGELCDYARRIAAYVPGANDVEREEAALLLLSGMAGTLMVARALDDREQSDRLLLAARRFYMDAMGVGAGGAGTDGERLRDTGDSGEAPR